MSRIVKKEHRNRIVRISLIEEAQSHSPEIKLVVVRAAPRIQRRGRTSLEPLEAIAKLREGVSVASISAASS